MEGEKRRVTIFWFRRDLRLYDNTGLYNALSKGNNVLPIFIFDTKIISDLPKNDKRVSFIYHQLKKIKENLEGLGCSLLVLHGEPLAVFKDLMKQYDIEAVYLNEDYEPYSVQRDAEIRSWALANSVRFEQFKDHVIFSPKEVLKKDATPYTVYTPFKKKWLELFQNQRGSIRIKGLIGWAFFKTPPFNFPTLKELGFTDNYPSIVMPELTTSLFVDYTEKRDFPDLDATSRVGVQLRYGTISIRELIKQVMGKSEVFLGELIWREFFITILWHYPQVVNTCFRKKYEAVDWVNDPSGFEKWKEGKTGFPIVDAGMRELNQTGYMHNRVRMITASFLTKHLLVDWRLGEAFFAEKLLDYELASNNGNWQWAAGTGCDAVPYFRVFNPELQQKKFDPKEDYVKKWVPEYGTKFYPKQMVNLAETRKRAIAAFKI